MGKPEGADRAVGKRGKRFFTSRERRRAQTVNLPSVSPVLPTVPGRSLSVAEKLRPSGELVGQLGLAGAKGVVDPSRLFAQGPAQPPGVEGVESPPTALKLLLLHLLRPSMSFHRLEAFIHVNHRPNPLVLGACRPEALAYPRPGPGVSLRDACIAWSAAVSARASSRPKLSGRALPVTVLARCSISCAYGSL